MTWLRRNTPWSKFEQDDFDKAVPAKRVVINFRAYDGIQGELGALKLFIEEDGKEVPFLIPHLVFFDEQTRKLYAKRTGGDNTLVVFTLEDAQFECSL